MKYTFDVDTNNQFVQIFGATESLKTAEAPLAFQIRGGIRVLESTLKVIETVIDRINYLDAHFHDDDRTAQLEFENGFVVFESGEVPVLAMVQRRSVYLSLAGRQVGSLPVSLVDFHRDLKKCLKKPRK